MNIDRSLAIKLGLGAVALVAAYVLITTVLSIATTLLPIAVLGVVGYMGYRVLTSRNENAKLDTYISERAAKETAKKVEVKATPKAAAKPAARLEVSDEKVTAADFLAEIGTPDLARLEAKEKQATQVTDSVLSQLEERKKRLGK